MHGLIFAEVKKYVVTKLGGEKWNELLEAAGVPGKVYLPTQVYPDGELGALVAIASRATGIQVPSILEDYGEFIVPDLIDLYRTQINPAWRTLDLIENTESLIHRLVRMKDPAARPPELVCRRRGTRTVVIEYRSSRKLCAVARGIVKGVAKHYGERVALAEPKCMLRADAHCDIEVEVS